MTADVTASLQHLLAHALVAGGRAQARGLAPGDRVALVVPQVGDFIQALFAISAAGLMPVPLCPPVQAGDLSTFAVSRATC